MASPLTACKDGGNKALLEDAAFGRRVFRPPPTDEVRAVPPHNIHGAGVGPYELSATFQETLALLPNGPRVERFESDGLFDYRLMRTDNDALLLGVGRGNLVTFISVLDPDIARTESGIGVGAGVSELIGALGAVRTPKFAGSDPRIVKFAALPDTRFVVEKGTVVAAIVMGPLRPAAPTDEVVVDTTGPASVETPEDPPERDCVSPEFRDRKSDILTVADFGTNPSSLLWTCLGDASGEAVVRSGEWLKIIDSPAPDAPLRVVAKIRVPGLKFAATLKTGGPRAELYTVSSKRDSKQHDVVVTRYKVGNGRILPVWSRSAFKLNSSAASWLGASLTETDFLVELRGRDRVLEVGGFFMQRSGGKLRNVVPVSTVQLFDGRSERKPLETPESPPGTDRSDAGVKIPEPSPAP
jgi:hypothetical protein